MSLVKLKTDENKTVTNMGWANPAKRKSGDVTEDRFTVYDLADEEAAKIVIGHSKLTGDTVTVDADYVAPADPEPEAPQPTTDQQMLAAVMLRVAKLEAGA